MKTSETFISIDIEASGPIPGEYSMLSLGACIVGASEQNFYVELKPITPNFQPEALQVAGFDLDDLARSGAEPARAMAQFEEWLARVTPPGQTPVFVGYPLAFDWMFVAYYFHRFLNRNPFGISGIDLKSYYYGMSKVAWSATGMYNMSPQFANVVPLTHNAREDAIVQGEVFARLLAHRDERTIQVSHRSTNLPDQAGRGSRFGLGGFQGGKMTDSTQPSMDNDKTRQEMDKIAATATRLGVELDEKEALQWIMAVSAAERETAFAQDAQTGVYGHRISLLDFDQAELDVFRRMAKKVRAARRPNIESAIAIAGSSAQGKVQLFPGDSDFFERINIKTDTLQAARQLWRTVLRETALRAFAEPDIVLMEANFGAYSVPVVERGTHRRAGHPITWTPQDVVNGSITVEDAYGQPLTITWDEAQSGAGCSFLAWIVADREAGQIGLASNMIDVTWESPSGEIVALDGSIDPFFQEIYLEPESVPVFTKIVKHVDPDAMKAYVDIMRAQVRHYAHEEPNFGKVSKRLYNLFRLTDQLEAAAYVRELFDEPGARLYQVPSLLEAANVALDPRSGVDRDTVIRQIDRVIRAVVDVTEGVTRPDLTMELISLRDAVMGRKLESVNWDQVLVDVNKRCSEIVNEYFRARLFGLPEIQALVESLKEESQGKSK